MSKIFARIQNYIYFCNVIKTYYKLNDRLIVTSNHLHTPMHFQLNQTDLVEKKQSLKLKNTTILQ